MEIEEHLQQHEDSLWKLAKKISKEYSLGRFDKNAKDILYSAGVVALMEIHERGTYNHDASLFTYANLKVKEKMHEEARRYVGADEDSRDLLDHTASDEGSLGEADRYFYSDTVDDALD